MLTVNFHPFPELETNRLKLQRIHETDEQDIFSLRSDQGLMQYIDRPHAQSLDDARELMQKIETALVGNDGITWAIHLKDTPGLIGTIGLWRMEKENYRAEIGYMLVANLQGKGIMKEALERVIEFGFADMKLHTIEANVNPANQSSIRLLERCGFNKEAYFRENYYFNGQFLDSLIYSKISPYPHHCE